MRAGTGSRAPLSASPPDRGDVWLAALDPVIPGEQGGTRPVLVLSARSFNSWPVGLAVVVPITTRRRDFAHHVEVLGGGLERESFAMPEYVRSVVQRRLRRRLGSADPACVATVADWVRRIVGL